ncbi:glycosyltransferase [Oculatella sp. LEGE 06141]|uniref:glycosyltransferase family 39 protein n=1 Tax=Oculatella sp. LEGE 06141 TaxID=1828648 RepID=UPI001882EA4B|nr:glycosyltransferase [Oculatella sp. LEGE 06141]MBE9178883.1 glycosyltransferase [Oculatella sp. LEGE 06141]
MWHRLKAFSEHPWFHPILLLVWIAIGTGLRFTNLDLKPLWTDEFSTIVFSLGNSFRTIPLDRVIPLDSLLQLLRPHPQAGVGSVVGSLAAESNHPPLYFVLTHLWLQLFPPTADGLVTAWQVRSLSALFGVLSIPAMFGLGWLAFRSRLVGHCSAVLMAVSPFGIYLAQEARHYTLPVLWSIASFCCLIVAARTIKQRRPLPHWIGVLWVIVNALGMATHFFFLLTLIAEGIVVILLGLMQSWRERGVWHPSYWGRLFAVALGTAATIVVWLPTIQTVQDGDLTQWIVQSDRAGIDWLDPLPRVIAGWITMLYLLPIQSVSQPTGIVSAIILVLLVLWTVPQLYRGLKTQYDHPRLRVSVQVLGGLVGVAIAMFLGITYILAIDLSSAFRYHFFYFPAVLAIAGAALASEWQSADKGDRKAMSPWFKPFQPGRWAVVAIVVMGMIGSLSVGWNMAYQKTHQPDRVIHEILNASHVPILITISHQTHGQTGRMMGLALELERQEHSSFAPEPLFFLDHQKCASLDDPNCHIPTPKLRRILSQLQRPFDVWLVNYHSSANLREQQCYADRQYHRRVFDGYKYHLYHCPTRGDES